MSKNDFRPKWGDPRAAPITPMPDSTTTPSWEMKLPSGVATVTGNPTEVTLPHWEAATRTAKPRSHIHLENNRVWVDGVEFKGAPMPIAPDFEGGLSLLGVTDANRRGPSGVLVADLERARMCLDDHAVDGSMWDYEGLFRDYAFDANVRDDDSPAPSFRVLIPLSVRVDIKKNAFDMGGKRENRGVHLTSWLLLLARHDPALGLALLMFPDGSDLEYVQMDGLDSVEARAAMLVAIGNAVLSDEDREAMSKAPAIEQTSLLIQRFWEAHGVPSFKTLVLAALANQSHDEETKGMEKARR